MDHVDAEHRVSRRDWPIRGGDIEEDRRPKILGTFEATIRLDAGQCAFVVVGRTPGNTGKGRREVTSVFAASAGYFENRTRRREDLFQDGKYRISVPKRSGCMAASVS